MSTVPIPSAEPAALAAAAAPRGRASWSGLLRLSLVTVPIKAYPAITVATETHCHQLHADCGQRIRYSKQCPVHGPVQAGGIVSGYPYAPNQYVVIDDDQLDQLRAPADRALCLEHFIDADDLDPVLFAGRSWYLMPDGVVAHYPYAVLSAAFRTCQKWAVGRVVMSGIRRLIVVRPSGNVLSMHFLHYPAQLRSRSTWEAELRAAQVAETEKDLAGQLIAAHSQPVNWSQYRDDRAEQLAALVQAALDKGPLVPAVTEPPAALSLVEALRKSVAATQAGNLAPPANGTMHPRGRMTKRSPTRRRS